MRLSACLATILLLTALSGPASAQLPDLTPTSVTIDEDAAYPGRDAANVSVVVKGSEPFFDTTSVTLAFKLDYFGYRPDDAKVAIATTDPGLTVEVRAPDGTLVLTIPDDGGLIAYQGNDGAPSGDDVWWIDFGSLTMPGTYALYSPTLDSRSYPFDIAEDVYDVARRAALKTFYYQRCNTAKPAAYAGAWADDAACHMSDTTTGPASGHTDHGIRDLSGGWHDAGDYNKYVWYAVSTPILWMVRAYEDNQDAFPDNDTNIPESGNGVSDLLDEIRYELDWLLKMQLENGSVLYQMHTDGWDWDSPPSADTNPRYYQDPNLESGSVFAGTCALGSRIFAAHGEVAYAETLKIAALAAWSWLQTQGDSDQKTWAAAELFRMDQTLTSARDYVDSYHASNWAGAWLGPQFYDTFAAVTYIQTPGATPSVIANMLASIGNAVDDIFADDDLYRNGMVDWAYHWGSNRNRSMYGLHLLQAAKLGATGTYTAEELVRHAQDYLHFFHGQNALNMVYLSNMAAYGGEHSLFQIYHGWFGSSGNAYSAANFLGKPGSVEEPDYPYFKGTDNHGISDDKTSALGPAPGYLPGGPNKDYGGTSIPPLNAVYYNRYYRDWADQTVWTAQTWEISENSLSYQGPYVALVSYFMANPSTNPPPVQNLRAMLVDTCVALIWSPVTEADHYVIYRDSLASFEPGPEDSVGATANTSYVDGVPAAVEAYYVVRAVDAVGHKSEDSQKVGQFQRALIVE